VQRTEPTTRERPSTGITLPAIFVGALLCARLVYLAVACPYSLAEDEASYWTWSKFLELSYYTKGPGVAWTIAGTTAVFGDTPFGVRVAAPCFVAVGALASAWLAWSITRRVHAAMIACVTFSLAPSMLALSIVHTIDAGLSAFWLLAACAAWKGLSQQRGRYVALAGLALGIATLFKYTALLLLPGVLIFACTQRRMVFHSGSRRHLALGALAGVLLFVFAVSPIILWNAHHGWPTLTHLAHHVGFETFAMGDAATLPPRPSYSPLWTLTYLATLPLIAGPALLASIALAIHATRTRSFATSTATSMGVWFCIWCSLPVLTIYLLVSLFTSPEGNWALAGTLTMFPLCGVAWLACSERDPQLLPRVRSARTPSFMQHITRAHVLVGLVLMLAAARIDLLARLPLVGALVPAGRLMGAETLGAHASEHLTLLSQQTGQQAIIMTQHYGRAAMLSFYAPSKPDIYCASLLTGGRTTSWDFWPHKQIVGNASLVGRPALLVGGTQEQWEPLFSRVEPIGGLRGDAKPDRVAFYGYNFRGDASTHTSTGATP
jgi:hypothetical protein